jgi:glucuronokinase
LRYAVGIARAEVPARAGLVGNPSDVFGGAIVGITIEGLGATVVAEPSLSVELEADGQTLGFESFDRLAHAEEHPRAGPLALMWAAAKRYVTERPEHGESNAHLKLESSTIPPGVGLAGSSAIVIATLRALGGLFGDQIADQSLPSVALAAERDELAITAGLGDRVVQVFGGLVYLDLARKGGPRVEPLDASRLPDMFVAWRPDAATDSGDVHNKMRERFKAGDQEVVATMREIAGLARAALKPLLTGDAGGLGILMERNLELRRSLYDLEERHIAMADAAHELGSAVNYTGSGGAIVGLLRDGSQLAELRKSLGELGCELVVRRAPGESRGATC